MLLLNLTVSHTGVNILRRCNLYFPPPPLSSRSPSNFPPTDPTSSNTTHSSRWFCDRSPTCFLPSYRAQSWRHVLTPHHTIPAIAYFGVASERQPFTRVHSRSRLRGGSGLLLDLCSVGMLLFGGPSCRERSLHAAGFDDAFPPFCRERFAS